MILTSEIFSVSLNNWVTLSWPPLSFVSSLLFIPPHLPFFSPCCLLLSSILYLQICSFYSSCFHILLHSVFCAPLSSSLSLHFSPPHLSCITENQPLSSFSFISSSCIFSSRTLFPLLSPPSFTVLTSFCNSFAPESRHNLSYTLHSYFSFFLLFTSSSLFLPPSSLLLHYSDWVLFGMACVVPE